jgi:hypothetical protein
MNEDLEIWPFLSKKKSGQAELMARSGADLYRNYLAKIQCISDPTKSSPDSSQIEIPSQSESVSWHRKRRTASQSSFCSIMHVSRVELGQFDHCHSNQS